MTLIKRKLQFAITREDPSIEASLIKNMSAKAALVICSGGDTIFALKKEFPSLSITTFDLNPAQITHFIAKASASDENIQKLCQAGNFESLFRQWRLFFNEFVMNGSETRKTFLSREHFPSEVFSSSYWEVSFDLHFHDSFLRAMFGQSAIQHAPPGSYPRYFQKVFEKGLKRNDYRQNPFLQHIFLGEYLDMPAHLLDQPDISQVKVVSGTIYDVPQIQAFDLIQLSNIFDWCSLEEIRKTCEYLSKNMKPGGVILLRQINNDSPVTEFLSTEFIIDFELSEKLVEADRSLFYSKIIVAKKV